MALPRPTAAFVVKVAAAHTVTYLVVGMAASATWDYARILSQPVISDYMLPFGSVNVIVAGLAQLVRGVVLALVLLPFRAVLGSRRGWLWLWALLVGIGIIGTYAAAPSSVEGVVYSRIPLWYHLMGLPEVVCCSASSRRGSPGIPSTPSSTCRRQRDAPSRPSS
jgi:hypothetical protein